MPQSWLPPRGNSSRREPTGPANPAATRRPDPLADLPPGAKRRQGGKVWDVLLGLNLALLATALLGAGLLGEPPQEAAAPAPLSPGVLWGEVAFSFVTFTLVPLLWVVGTRVDPIQGSIDYLHLRRVWPHAAWGVLWTGALVLGAGAIALAYDAVGGSTDNPALESITAGITLPLAIALSLAAGIGEEILFRGILMKRLGVVGQAAVFGLAHVGYGTVLQVVVPAVLALFFGILVRRTGSLWGAIVAHVLFDLLVFSSILAGGTPEDPSAALAW